MKTKDLIAKLQNADPSGGEHVCVHNADIMDVRIEPAYYDGALQVFDRDSNGHPIRGRRVRTGIKILIDPIYLWDLPNCPIEYVNEEDRQRYELDDQERIRKDNEIENTVDRDLFCEWVFRKIQQIRPVPFSWVERIREAGIKFYNEQRMGPDDPFVKSSIGKSQAEWMEEYWSEIICVDWDKYSRIIIGLR